MGRRCVGGIGIWRLVRILGVEWRRCDNEGVVWVGMATATVWVDIDYVFALCGVRL